MSDNETKTDATVVTRNNKVDMFVQVASVVYLYCLMHPEQVEWAVEKLTSFRDHIAHRVSVYRARRAIWSLPETDSE